VYGWVAVHKRSKRPTDFGYFIYNPPSNVQFEGLPENVIPLTCSSNTIKASLSNDHNILISQSQIEVLVNFSMTDYASQGKTDQKILLI
jgi:hypothetical protein